MKDTYAYTNSSGNAGEDFVKVQTNIYVLRVELMYLYSRVPMPVMMP
jgi:hypothetical protein